MIPWHPGFRRLGIAAIPFLLFFLISTGLSISAEDSTTVVITFVGLGAPPSEQELPDSAPRIGSAVDDARKKAVLSYLYSVLGREEFFRLENAIDALVLPEYQKYCGKTEIISISPLPGGDTAAIKAAVTIDAAALASYLENIKKLEAKPEVRRTLSAAEKEILISKAQAIYIQGEVASDILQDRLRGIESFLSAQTLFETAESTEGIYGCLMGLGRAHASLGDVAAARVNFERALELAGDLKKPELAAGARIALARIMFVSGDTVAVKPVIEAVLNDTSLSGHEELVGEALLTDAELDYGARRYESARTKAERAVAIFQRLADIKRLTGAHLLAGLILIAEGDGTGAAMEFKLANKLADKLDDRISAVKALIGMSRAYRIAGEPKTASLYLSDALKTARDSGWIFGEVVSLCETALVQVDLGDSKNAETSAGAAYTLALSQDTPSLIAASLFVVGVVSRSLGNDDAAIDALGSCIRTSSDIRVIGRDIPFLFFGDAERAAALADLLALSVDLGREKKAFRLVFTYEGSTIAREVLSDPPPLPGREAELVRRFRDAAGRVMATDDISLGGDFTKTAEGSRAEITRLRNEADRSLSDIKTRIVRESPRLAAFTGLETDDHADLSRTLPEGNAFVHYVVDGKGAFALVVTGREAFIVRLGGGFEEIMSALERVKDAADTIDTTPGTAAGTDGEIPLAFSEPSTALASILVYPLLPGLAGVTTVGISPGPVLSSLPIQALGRYDDGGRFVFLGEEYTLFYASCLSPGVAIVQPPPSGPINPAIVIIGDENILAGEPIGPSTDGKTPDEGDGPRDEAPGDENAPRFLHYPEGTPWWEAEAELAVFPEGKVWGSSDFSGLEYLSFMTSAPVVVVPKGIGRDGASAFLRSVIAASRDRALIRGYSGVVRTSAEDSRSGRPLKWVFFMLISDFVSEKK